MKKGALFLIIILTLSFPIVSAGFFDWLKEKLQLSPSQPTDVRVQVGNVAPTIQSISAIPDVNLDPAPDPGTSVIFTFTARDSNGAADLNDASASANFNRAGETTRNGVCAFQSQAGKERTYQCTVDMQYYDKVGTWNIAVSIQDQAGLTATSTSTFTVNFLNYITISPTVINFPAVAQDDTNVISISPTTITNGGNFEVPVNGDLSVTSFDLQGETNPAEIIPASNFRAVGSAGAGTVCATGNALIDSTAVPITATLPRGPSDSNTEDLSYCLTLVPGGISTQFYSATGGRSWIITI